MNKLNLARAALASALFLAVLYGLCVAFDLLFPRMAMYVVWQRLLPGFTWLTPGSFVLGLIESLLYGVLFAIVFVPIYNATGKVFAEKHAA